MLENLRKRLIAATDMPRGAEALRASKCQQFGDLSLFDRQLRMANFLGAKQFG